MILNGELIKLKITSYKDSDFMKGTGSFEVMLNPSNYTSLKGINYDKGKIIDGGNMPVYKGYSDESLKFQFTLDATGALIGNAAVKQTWDSMDLAFVMSKLDDVVYSYIGDSHQPPFLKIEWGPLSYTGRLSRMEVKYTHFAPDGNPLRGQVDLDILAFRSWETQNIEKNKSSPDLSHLVTVRAGDTLPLLCERIYKTAVYCIDVAAINGLDDFRSLELGSQLIFPPLSNN